MPDVYCADPDFKNVPGLANIGFPVAQIYADDSCIPGKPAGMGGRIDYSTRCRETLLAAAGATCPQSLHRIE